VTDRRAPQFTVQPEQRHQVDRGQRVGGHSVEVTEVRGIEPCGVHQLGEQVLVDPIAAASTVLVVLDRDESRFRQPGEARDRPGVGIALLEVIERTMHEVLLHLLPCTAVTQVIGRAVAVDRLQGNRVHFRGGTVVGGDLADVAADGRQKRVLEASAQMKQSGIPFPSGIDRTESAIVQLVADIER
jgi:hypothetical protein